MKHPSDQAGAIPPPVPDRAAILEALSALFGTDDVIELRAFHKGRKRTDAGYFDGEHREALADAAVRLNAAGAAVYVTLNRIDPQLLGRYCNRVEKYAQATVTDANVTRRRWLLIDFDPVRPKDTAAIDTQLAAALKRGRECCQALQAEGWPDPIECESGNGVHLLYPLDLPNDTESRDLVKGALAGLATRFDDDAVKVDQSVFNAGRIVKLYGTTATKGDHTLLAPWRLSRVTWGLAGEPVTPGQLLALHPKGNGIDSISADLGDFSLPSFLSRLGVPYDQDSHEGRERYKLAYCPFNPDHGKGEAAVFRAVSGQLGFKCMHSSCADKTWQHVRALVDGPPESRRASAGPQGSSSEPRVGVESPVGGAGGCQDPLSKRVILVRGDTIRPEPIRWLWVGWLARGMLHILAGSPGCGKSTIGLAVAATLTSGRNWPDETPCALGDVLIWSGEDGTSNTLLPRFLAAGGDPGRIHFIENVIGPNGPRHFDPAFDLPELLVAARAIPDLRYVLVDPIVSAVTGDSHKNTEVRRSLQPLVDMAAELDVALLGISHFSKGTAGREPVERVIGSVAFGALSRLTLVAAKIQGDGSERRIFCRGKSNIGPDDGGWEYSLALTDVPGSPGICVTRVAWGAPLEGSARDLLAAADAVTDPEQRSARDEAADWLRDLLSGGPVKSRQVMAAAKQAAIAAATLRRAKTDLRVKVGHKGGYLGEEKQEWYWRLPFSENALDDQPAQNALDDQKTPVFLNLDHLVGNVSPKRFSGAPSALDDQHSGRRASSALDDYRSDAGPGVVEVEV